MNLLKFSLTFVMFSFATCHEFSFRALRDVDETCPVDSCMESKIDMDTVLEDAVNVSYSANGIRVRFKEGIFSYGCSIYQMFLGCVNDLTPEKLAVCIPPEEQQIAFMVFPTIDNIVCSRVKRLDKLVPCMNAENVQKLFFEELLFAGYQFMESFKGTGALPCDELKKKYIETVTKLSNMCNNDGLAALLEIDNDLVTELRQLITMYLMSMRLTPDDVCLDALQEATMTAKSLLTY
ncbi:uncharacterized protein LOC111106055 [Crassostrea virginica]